jgi:DMSO reductase anchor subunit
MNPSFTGQLPKTAYLRLLEYQRQKMSFPAYAADLPLLLFIFSRIAAGLSIMSVFFHPPFPGWAWLFCMVLATTASITHLTVPRVFHHDHQPPIALVWEIRLAGALTVSLGAQLLFRTRILPGFETLLLWSTFFLSILFLMSTGWAYRFPTHPAWKTNILLGYYLVSALMIGYALYSTIYPNPFFRPLTVTFLCANGYLILLYLNHLCKTSWISLKRIDSGKDRGISLAFLISVLLIPGMLTFVPLFTKDLGSFAAVLALSSVTGVIFERILFFRLEQPVYFLSRT